MYQAQGRFEARFEAILPTLATKTDLAELRLVTKADIADLRFETKADIANVRVEVADVRTQIADPRAEMYRLHAALVKWMMGMLATMFIGFGGMGITLYRLPTTMPAAPAPTAAPSQAQPSAPASAHTQQVSAR